MLLLPVQAPAAPECRAPGAAVAIDHVVIAVHDLEVASRTYRDLGFTAKKGRLLDKGLLNEHLKFCDGTRLELMSVVDDPAEILRHANGAEGIRRVRVETNAAFGRLLSALGADTCAPPALPDSLDESTYGLSNAELVLVPPEAPRPRVLSVALTPGNDMSGQILRRDDTHGIRLRLPPKPSTR